MQSLYEYFIGFWLNSKDWLGTIYASFGIQGLNGYSRCILWSFKNKRFFKIFPQATPMFNFNLNSYQKVYWTTNYCQEWYFGFSFYYWDIFFFYYHRHLVVSRTGLSFNDSKVVLSFCSWNLMAPMLACLELHKVIY